MCDCLVSERNDHKTEINSVVFMNTKLKGELAELDIKCNDLSISAIAREDWDSECQSLQQQMQHLQNYLAELSAQIESRKLNLNLKSIVDFKLSHDILPSGSLNCTAGTQETNQLTGAVHAGTPRAGRREPRSERVSSQHAAPTDGQDIIMYSDEFGSQSLSENENNYQHKLQIVNIDYKGERLSGSAVSNRVQFLDHFYS
ncbi:hypothetical protein EVAR_39323_1 [Eumeta japonica]|uniref:Uncharacterized protein n=1 Tax=Eumeta variegata TaxID=151549 RepID=A0A4C1VZL4_EUMVA|nr:hypothetical protein EVAR_39323_1 [Eumeta japonica]